jgi:hypothetical protein
VKDFGRDEVRSRIGRCGGFLSSDEEMEGEERFRRRAGTCRCRLLLLAEAGIVVVD